MKPLRLILLILSGITFSLLVISCRGRKELSPDEKIVSHPLPDTLRVATLYSPEAYFIYRGQEMGYDYELISSFSKDKHITLSLNIAPSLSRALEMLDSGMVDLIAYEVPVTAELKDKFVGCGPESITTQVLVQPKNGDEEIVKDVVELIGKDVYVEADSKYEARIKNLNQEVGGGINIHTVDRDTMITEDLIAMVNEGKIPLTIVDSNIARINKTYYKNLDITLQLSFEQRSSWAVSQRNSWLADSIDTWINSDMPRESQSQLLKRYFELSKSEPDVTRYLLGKSSGISPFDNLFKKFSGNYGWDWKLLASQAYVESRFDSTVVSWAGARGIMQIMPRTAQGYGQTSQTVVKNDVAVETALKILRDLDRSLKPYVSDATERKKFVIAGYNSGLAHILDAINLAKKYGLDPQKWDDNVAKAILWKSNPKYYKDPIVKYGYLRGRETFDYVNNVYSFYHKATAKS